jgi:hypothetical protein
MTWARRLQALTLAGALALCAGPAPAYTLGVPAIATVALGKFVADSTVSVFSVSASTGVVTKISGTAIRLTSGTVATPTVTITCATAGGGGKCNRTVTVQIVAGSTLSGRPTTITKFNVSNLSGPAGVTFSPSAPAPAAPLTFSIVSTANSYTVTFKVGITASFNASATTGNTDWTYTVSVS